MNTFQRKKTEKRITRTNLTNWFKKDQVDHALVYAAIKLAVQNDSVLSKNTEQTKESENEIDEISDKIQIFLNQ